MLLPKWFSFLYRRFWRVRWIIPIDLSWRVSWEAGLIERLWNKYVEPPPDFKKGEELMRRLKELK